MPIHVDIRVNEGLVSRVHIGRTQTFRGEDYAHLYRVVQQDVPDHEVDYFAEGSVEFDHRYGDGLLTCVRKGLEALGHADPQ